MCGFAGFFDSSFSDQNEAAWSRLLGNMGDAIRHRGPDGEGVWMDIKQGIGLVHRRLAILDLSPAGNQPMLSHSGRYLIVFNGEIYNHLEIRKKLAQHGMVPEWRGQSDTETLLAAIELWGLKEALCQSMGMFSIALWDRKLNTLTLARDRLGEKPLYYGYQDGKLLFGSELKALKTHSAFNAEIDRNALTYFLRYSCVPSPLSIYSGMFKIVPGTLIEFTLESIKKQELPKPIIFWSLMSVAANGVVDPFTGTDNQAINCLESVLNQAIEIQQLADVPLGAFLSGGVDSSTVVALMQAQSSRPVKTFTIGFNEQAYNEAEQAKAISRHLGTEHVELYVTALEARKVIPLLPQLYDEPFGDSSQIPTFLLAKLAKEHVKVSLSGDAGDELFGGYNRYVLARTLWEKLSYLPLSVRRTMGVLIGTISPKSWNSLYGALQQFLPQFAQITQPGDKMQKLAEIISASGPEDIYQRLLSNWNDPTGLVVNTNMPRVALEGWQTWSSDFDFEQNMMTSDMLGYLPDDILVKVDRAAMGVSLETRLPLLDPKVVEFAWRIPMHMKIRQGQGKWILRQVLYRYVPKELIERPKMGFSVPIDSWLRGPLRDWAEDLLNEKRLLQEGFFHPKQIRDKWEEHLSGKRNWQKHLWNVLMFQSWLEEQNHWLKK